MPDLNSTMYWRQLDILSPDRVKDVRVMVIGVGGVGSPVALALAKMGMPHLTIFDDDVVDTHNLPNQLYRLKDFGRPKVEALAEIIADFAHTTVVPRNEQFTGATTASGIVISAVHTMEARRAIWNRVKYNPNVPLFIDSRMGGQVGRLYAVNPLSPDECRRYEATLYSDEETVSEPCTSRAIIYTVFLMSSLIANLVKKHCQGEEVPFETLFDMVNLLLLPSEFVGYTKPKASPNVLETMFA